MLHKSVFYDNWPCNEMNSVKYKWLCSTWEVWTRVTSHTEPDFNAHDAQVQRLKSHFLWISPNPNPNPELIYIHAVYCQQVNTEFFRSNNIQAAGNYEKLLLSSSKKLFHTETQ